MATIDAAKTTVTPVYYISGVNTVLSTFTTSVPVGHIITVMTNPFESYYTLDTLSENALSNIPGSQAFLATGKNTYTFTNNSTFAVIYTTDPAYAATATHTIVLKYAACFLADAPVLTPAGYVRIDALKVGDLVMSEGGAAVAVTGVKIQVTVPSPKNNPFVILKGLYGAIQDLPISRYHAIKMENGQMVMAKHLDLPQKKMTQPFSYYNLEVEGAANMIVAGVTVESWHLR